MKIFLKRTLAYLIDALLVSLLVTLISGTPINPNYKKLEKVREDYNEVYTYYNDVINQVTTIYNLEEVNSDDIENFNTELPEYSNKMIEIYEDKKIDEEEYENFLLMVEENFLVEYDKYFYEIKSLSIFQDIIYIVLLILYFVFFAYFTCGQTLGKKLLKLQVVSCKDKKLNIGNYLIRSCVLNGIVITTIDVILRLILKENSYINSYNYLYTLSYTLELAIAFSVMINVEKRGIHDLLSGTKVIDLKESKVEENVKEVKVKKERKQEK